MFDIAISFITDFISIIPTFVCLILIFNIISSLLWGDK